MMFEQTNLSALHESLYKMLVDFDSLCKAKNIEYWIDAGTLLGAVRHGGFIPWDDDIDICMSRENYERFLTLDSNDLPRNRYVIKPYEGYYAWAKYCDNTVNLREVWGGESHLFIDVFPFEKYKKLYVLSRFRWFLAYLARRKRFLSAARQKLSWKQKILQIIPIEAIERAIGITPAAPDDPNAGYRVGKECMYFEKRFIPEDVIFPLITVQFRDFRFPCPRNTHAYLTAFYGDYMKLPEDRQGHFSPVGEGVSAA